MSKDNFLRVLLAIAVAMSLSQAVAARDVPKSDGTTATFVLVHGTFQWGEQWDPLVELLEAEGHLVQTPTLPKVLSRSRALGAPWAFFPMQDFASQRLAINKRGAR